MQNHFCQLHCQVRLITQKEFSNKSIVKRLAGVTPEVNLRNPLHVDDKSCKRGTYAGYEIKDRGHQKSKTGVSVAQQKGLMSSNFFLKFKYNANPTFFRNSNFRFHQWIIICIEVYLLDDLPVAIKQIAYLYRQIKRWMTPVTLHLKLQHCNWKPCPETRTSIYTPLQIDNQFSYEWVW